MKERAIAARTLLRPWMIGASAGLLVAAFATDAICSQSIHTDQKTATPHENAATAWHVVPPGHVQEAHHRDDFLDLLDVAGSPSEAW
jgi:hypothetical protein